jgi:hypothetical protein
VSPPAGTHPLADILLRAAHGTLPPTDGAVELLPALEGPVDAICSFTAHAVLAVDIPAEELLTRLDPNDLGAPMSATFLAWVAKRLGTTPGVLDVVMVAPASSSVTPVALEPRDDLVGHPRVRRAARYRRDLRVFADPSGAAVLVIGRGLAGRWEMAFEVDQAARGRGLGRGLAAAARSLVPQEEPLFAEASPGNAASIRSLIAAGYIPIGGECLFARS